MIELELVAKRPYNTVNLHVKYTDESVLELQGIYDTLREIGWKPSENRSIPPVKGVTEVMWKKPGVGLFGGWHRSERKILLQQVRDKLAQIGYEKITYRRA